MKESYNNRLKSLHLIHNASETARNGADPYKNSEIQHSRRTDPTFIIHDKEHGKCICKIIHPKGSDWRSRIVEINKEKGVVSSKLDYKIQDTNHSAASADYSTFEDEYNSFSSRPEEFFRFAKLHSLVKDNTSQKIVLKYEFINHPRIIDLMMQGSLLDRDLIINIINHSVIFAQNTSNMVMDLKLCHIFYDENKRELIYIDPYVFTKENILRSSKALQDFKIRNLAFNLSQLHIRLSHLIEHTKLMASIFLPQEDMVFDNDDDIATLMKIVTLENNNFLLSLQNLESLLKSENLWYEDIKTVGLKKGLRDKFEGLKVYLDDINKNPENRIKHSEKIKELYKYSHSHTQIMINSI